MEKKKKYRGVQKYRWNTTSKEERINKLNINTHFYMWLLQNRQDLNQSGFAYNLTHLMFWRGAVSPEAEVQ